MKFISKFSSFVLAAAITLTIGAVNTSADFFDEGTQTPIIEDSDCDVCNQINLDDLRIVSVTSSCTHNGTEKTVTFVGKCYCDSFLYRINCKAYSQTGL